MTPSELQATRKRLGYSQRALADALGTTQSSVDRWEHGRRPIPPLLCLALVGLECKMKEAATRERPAP